MLNDKAKYKSLFLPNGVIVTCVECRLFSVEEVMFSFLEFDVVAGEGRAHFIFMIETNQLQLTLFTASTTIVFYRLSKSNKVNENEEFGFPSVRSFYQFKLSFLFLAENNINE